MTSNRTRPLAALLTGAALLAASAGCGTVDITRAKLQDDVGPTYRNMYVLQHRLLGQDADAPAQLATADCAKGGPETPDEGPGDDWTCQVYWPVNGTLQTLSYEVQVKATGCYTAQGPAYNVGRQDLHDPDGRTVPNPLYAFDGCLNTG
ncbi:hypothetical protein [Actinoallomurus iriomotensis]|uniref:Lipoprotein n=1 Tax=Actinoallomurus iriomotensis TaxID=478107 RepID=A0A9W6S048_9ACTN|nr:hypothetical protein [Actinoallomurus iriomotensis]GLY84994.1 hypothetical protein Airi02_029230 [Actinoallomurus iriomotensis]